MNVERKIVKAVKVTIYILLVILGWLAIGFVESYKRLPIVSISLL